MNNDFLYRCHKNTLGAKDRLPQDGSPWHDGWVKKTIEPQQIQEKLFTSSLNCLKKNLDYLLQEEGYHHIYNFILLWTRDGRQGGSKQGLFDQSPLCPTVSEGPTNMSVYQTLALFQLPVNCIPSFWSPVPDPTPFSLGQNDIYTSLCLTVFRVSMFVWILHTHTQLNFIFSSLSVLCQSDFQSR